MTRKIELAVLAATLAIAAPFTAASAATRHHAAQPAQPAQPVMIEPTAATPAPATGFFAANGAAAYQHLETLVQASEQGRGGDGGGNN